MADPVIEPDIEEDVPLFVPEGVCACGHDVTRHISYFGPCYAREENVVPVNFCACGRFSMAKQGRAMEDPFEDPDKRPKHGKTKKPPEDGLRPVNYRPVRKKKNPV